MGELIILSRADLSTLYDDDKPVTVYVNGRPYVICTEEYFERQKEIVEGEEA